MHIDIYYMTGTQITTHQSTPFGTVPPCVVPARCACAARAARGARAARAARAARVACVARVARAARSVVQTWGHECHTVHQSIQKL